MSTVKQVESETQVKFKQGDRVWVWNKYQGAIQGVFQSYFGINQSGDRKNCNVRMPLFNRIVAVHEHFVRLRGDEQFPGKDLFPHQEYPTSFMGGCNVIIVKYGDDNLFNEGKVVSMIRDGGSARIEFPDGTNEVYRKGEYFALDGYETDWKGEEKKVEENETPKESEQTIKNDPPVHKFNWGDPVLVDGVHEGFVTRVHESQEGVQDCYDVALRNRHGIFVVDRLTPRHAEVVDPKDSTFGKQDKIVFVNYWLKHQVETENRKYTIDQLKCVRLHDKTSPEKEGEKIGQERSKAEDASESIGAIEVKKNIGLAGNRVKVNVPWHPDYCKTGTIRHHWVETDECRVCIDSDKKFTHIDQMQVFTTSDLILLPQEECGNTSMTNDPNTKESNSIDHPTHYNSHPSGIECIEIVKHFNFSVGNAIKYLWRAGLKGDAIEDLKKAKWYIDCEIEMRKGKETAKKKNELTNDH